MELHPFSTVHGARPAHRNLCFRLQIQTILAFEHWHEQLHGNWALVGLYTLRWSAHLPYLHRVTHKHCGLKLPLPLCARAERGSREGYGLLLH